MDNEILTEVYRLKDELARKYDYDFDTLVAAIKERERCSTRQIVTAIPYDSSILYDEFDTQPKPPETNNPNE
jgi:hypothetical protein